jgi:hypothetical protein
MVKAGTCGWCGSKDTDAEYVDNGVGMQQVTAAVCNHCGAVQIGPYNEEEHTDPEDKRRGWYASGETLSVIAEDEALLTIRARDYNNGERMLVEHEGTVHQAFKRVSWADPTFQFACGVETAIAQRPTVDIVTCFNCIAYWAKGRP